MQTAAIQAAGVAPESPATVAPHTAQKGFVDLLQQATEQVNRAQQAADKAAQDFALGNTPDIHDTIIAIEKADLSLRLLTQVRNKAVEAYQEVMRMQI